MCIVYMCIYVCISSIVMYNTYYYFTLKILNKFDVKYLSVLLISTDAVVYSCTFTMLCCEYRLI